MVFSTFRIRALLLAASAPWGVLTCSDAASLVMTPIDSIAKPQEQAISESAQTCAVHMSTYLKKGDLLGLRYTLLKSLDTTLLQELIKNATVLSISAGIHLAVSELCERLDAQELPEALANVALGEPVDLKAFLSLDDRRALSALLVTEIQNKRTVLCSSISPLARYIAVSYVSDSGGDCDFYGLPFGYKETSHHFEEPIIEVQLLESGYILYRSAHHIWYSNSPAQDPFELRASTPGSPTLGMIWDTDHSHIVGVFQKAYVVCDPSRKLLREFALTLSDSHPLACQWSAHSLFILGNSCLQRILLPGTIDSSGLGPIHYELGAVKKIGPAAELPDSTLADIPQQAGFHPLSIIKRVLPMNPYKPIDNSPEIAAYKPLYWRVLLSGECAIFHALGNLSYWNMSNGDAAHEHVHQCLRTTVVHDRWPYEKSQFRGLCFDGSGTAFLVAAGRTAAVYDVLSQDFRAPIECSLSVQSGCFHPDRIHVALAIGATKIVLADSNTGQQLAHIDTPGPLTSHYFSHDGSSIIATGETFLRLLHVSNGNIGAYLESVTPQQAYFLRRVLRLLHDVAMQQSAGTHKAQAFERTLMDKQVQEVFQSLDPIVRDYLLKPLSLSVQNADGLTPLHAAARFGDTDELRKYLHDVHRLSADGKTALIYAARAGSVEKMEMLIAAGAEASVTDKVGESALHAAVASGNKAAVQFLKESGVNLNGPWPTPVLIKAVVCGSPEMCEYLLEAGAHINTTDAEGWTALHHGAKRARLEIIRILLAHDGQATDLPEEQKKAAIDLQDSAGMTPLHRAVLEGNDDMCALLSSHGADFEKASYAGKTPLASALGTGNERIIHTLVALYMKKAGCAGEADLIHYAASTKNKELLIYVLYKGEYVLALVDVDKNTPLHLALAHGAYDCAALLLDHLEAQHARIRRRRTPVVTMPAALPNCAGVTPLHFAVRAGYSDLAQRIVALKASPHARTIRDETPLHYAAFYGAEPCVRYLLSLGVARDAKTVEGKRAFDLAVEKENLAIIEVLCQYEEAQLIPESYFPPDWSLLHGLASRGCTSCIHQLLKRGGAVEPINRAGETPIFLAVDRGHLDTVIVLLNEGARLVTQDAQGRTILHRAAIAGTLEILTQLWTRKVDVLAADDAGKTALTYALEYRHRDCVEFLLFCEATMVSTENVIDWSPLRCAQYLGYENIVSFLQEAREHESSSGGEYTSSGENDYSDDSEGDTSREGEGELPVTE